jgi:antitoxin (DNA-binding transcriptional repressor) of toxin-antitoxin stability system
MKALTIHQTKTQLSALLRKVDEGRVVTFGERGLPQYQIKKLVPTKVDRSKAFGAWKGKAEIRGDIVSPDHDIERVMSEGAL